MEEKTIGVNGLQVKIREIEEPFGAGRNVTVVEYDLSFVPWATVRELYPDLGLYGLRKDLPFAPFMRIIAPDDTPPPGKA